MERIGKYAFVRCVGRGGMAEVWTGKSFGSSGFEKVVAIKILAPELVDKESYHRALTDEALLAAKLKHPNIVDIYDLNLEAEKPFMVMEYIEGQLLHDIAGTRHGVSQPMENVLSYATQIAEGLNEAHEKGIVHRDIKPANIMVTSKGQVKLS